MEQKNQKEKF